jgi:uncharacterized membrane protein YiaA
MTIKRIISWILGVLFALPMVYAKTYEQPINITSFIDLFQWTNRVTGYYFGIGILIAVFFISFVLLKAFESKQAFVGCLFVTSIVAITLRLIDILNNTWAIGSIILCGLAILAIVWSKD